MSTKSTALTLAALVAATLSTAVFAEAGPMGGPGMMPMMNFDQIDADKDGKITKDEMLAQMTARMTEADSNKDGKLSADELIAMREKAEAARKAGHAAAMITKLDSDSDGLLSPAELAAAEGPDMMFDRLDANSDGAVTQDEIDAMKAEMQEHMGGEGWGYGMHGGHGMHRGQGGGFWGWMSGNN